MMQTILRDRRLTRGRPAPICWTAFLSMLFAGLFAGPLKAQVDCDANALLTIGDTSARPGEVVFVEIRGSSLCDVNGFGMAIGYDSSRLDFLQANAGSFLEERAQTQDLGGSRPSAKHPIDRWGALAPDTRRPRA